MASQTGLLQTPIKLFRNPTKSLNSIIYHRNSISIVISSPSAHRSTSCGSSLPVVSTASSKQLEVVDNLPPLPPQSSLDFSLTSSNRTATTLLIISISAAKFLAGKIEAIYGLFPQVQPLIYSSVGPAFFASIGENPAAVRLDTPFSILAGGMAKWLDIYIEILSLRCLLTWFPNIPWDKQPLLAIRELSDPYLSLFRTIVPPVFNSLDLSPLLAFTVLGTLGTILRRM